MGGRETEGPIPCKSVLYARGRLVARARYTQVHARPCTTRQYQWATLASLPGALYDPQAGTQQRVVRQPGPKKKNMDRNREPPPRPSRSYRMDFVVCSKPAGSKQTGLVACRNVREPEQPGLQVGYRGPQRGRWWATVGAASAQALSIGPRALEQSAQSCQWGATAKGGAWQQGFHAAFPQKLGSQHLCCIFFSLFLLGCVFTHQHDVWLSCNLHGLVPERLVTE